MRSNFNDVGKFHEKFGLPFVEGSGWKQTEPPRPIDEATRDFRMKFLLEELTELAEGYGLELEWTLKPAPSDEWPCKEQDLPKIADSLVDLVYVALGTAHLHMLPWEKLWEEVQRANITKERCGIDHQFDKGIPDEVTEQNSEDYCLYPGEPPYCGKPRVAHSLRGSAQDVIKPAGWKAPEIQEVLVEAGWPGPRLPFEEETHE